MGREEVDEVKDRNEGWTDDTRESSPRVTPDLEIPRFLCATKAARAAHFVSSKNGHMVEPGRPGWPRNITGASVVADLSAAIVIRMT
jgi:hypothetical protein